MSNNPNSLLILRHEVFLGTLLLTVLSFCGMSHAAPVTPNQAKVAVRRWLSSNSVLGGPLRGTVADVRTCTPTNGVSFHVVRLSGGGFVVTSADTGREPVVAFASRGDLVEDDSSPLWTLLRNDLAIRTSARPCGGLRLMGASVSAVESGNEVKWARLLGGGMQLLSASGDGIESFADVRVAPLVQSRWGQDVAGGGNCFNYFTPNNYQCGCVATTGAQIMRYFCCPTASMPQYTNRRCKVDGVTRALTTQGGIYDWESMPLVPDSSLTEGQRQAIGKLTSDLGICCGMEYWPEGSAAAGYMLAHALTNNFGYSSALAVQWPDDVDKSQSEEMKNALLSNFDAGYPVVISLKGSGGHVVVSDGYGYSDGALYLHFNMGWDGLADAWYAPPEMDTGAYDFSVVDGFVFNINLISPDAVIYSGRVLDADGVPVEGAVVGLVRDWGYSESGIASASTVAYARTNEKGIYSAVLLPGEWTFSVGDTNASVTVKANVATRIAATSGGYWPTPVPLISNRWGMDFVVSDVVSVAAPQLAPSSCLFHPSTNVAISCATSGATIRYTLDGSEPTPTSAVYTGPIFVDDDMTIKVRAWKEGMNPSEIVTATYTYDATQGPPKGDYFDNPIVIAGESGSRTINDNSCYTIESGEPWHTSENGYHMYQYRSIWFKWTAPGSGTMSFTTKAIRKGGTTWTRYHTYVAVYTGDTLSTISRVAFAQVPDSANEYATTVTLNVENGVTYRIVGMINPDATAEFTFSWFGNLRDGTTHAVMFDAGGATGTPPSALSAPPGSPVVLPGRGNLSMDGYVFAGWYDGTRMYSAGSEYIIVDGADVTLVALWEPVVAPKGIGFAVSEVAVNEGETATIRVNGGAVDSVASVKVYLTWNTATSMDVDLGKMKFPVTLVWEKGEIGEKAITIPVKTDKTVEDDEIFTLQLANVEGMELDENLVCDVTIRDRNQKSLKAALTPYRPKKGEQVVTNSVTVAELSYDDECGVVTQNSGGFVAGTGEYTIGSKLTLVAEPRPGWAFIGWTLAGGGYAGREILPEDILSTKAKWQITVTNDEDYVAVFKKIPYVRGMADPADGGKVTGSGYCAAGKKVTLKATANRNFVFAGWFSDAAMPVANQKTSTTVTNIDSDVTYVARFITVEEDRAAITLNVNGEPLLAAGAGCLAWSNYCGVAVHWPVVSGGLSETTVKVSGLPTGLKLVQDKVTKAYLVEGAPTMASKVDKNTGLLTPAKVKFSVTTEGKTTETFAINLVVLPLPAWVAGTFYGHAGRVLQSCGQASLTVAANGKISGKLLEGGKTWTLSAASFDAVCGGYETTTLPDGDDLDLTFHAAVIGKMGKETVTNEVTVAAVNGIGIVSGHDATVEWSAWQNLWKRGDTKAKQPVFKKNIVVDCYLGEQDDVGNLVKITFKKDGVVSFAGKVGGMSVSGSSQLVWNAGYGTTTLPESYGVTLYASPKGTFNGWCETFSVILEHDAAGVVTRVALEEH